MPDWKDDDDDLDAQLRKLAETIGLEVLPWATVEDLAGPVAEELTRILKAFLAWAEPTILRQMEWWNLLTAIAEDRPQAMRAYARSLWKWFRKEARRRREDVDARMPPTHPMRRLLGAIQRRAPRFSIVAGALGLIQEVILAGVRSGDFVLASPPPPPIPPVH